MHFLKNLVVSLIFAVQIFGIDPFSPEELNLFYDDFVYKQANIVNAALHQPLLQTSDVTPPPGMLNYAPLVVVNNTGIDASRLYIIGKGQTLAATDAYFLQPNLSTGICTLVPGSSNNSADPNISVPLSKLPSAGKNAYYIYVPQMISGRFYLSVDTPLYMETAFNQITGYYAINDPSQTTIQDPNYYTLYQDFEFTLDKNYDLYANVTNVDYFALPLTLGSHSYPTGNLYPTLDNLTVVGFPTTSGRSSILSAIQTGLLNDQSVTPQWKNLSIPFYANPYTDTSALTYLRILAAKLSIGLAQSAIGVPFRGAAVTQAYFGPTDITTGNSLYLQSTTSGPDTGVSYMEQLYNYYNSGGHQLQLTIFPKDYPQATYTMTASSTAGTLNLTVNGSPTGAPPLITVILGNVTTESLLSGAIGDWVHENAITPTSTDPWQTEIVKMLSALFTAGMLPPASSVTQPMVDDSTYFSSYRGAYFSNPAGSPTYPFSSHGPWYNLYDQVIHPLLIQTNNFGLGYAYDFDDLLDLAGLLHVNIQTGGILNLKQPYYQLTAGPIDTPIPNATENFGPYDMQFTISSSTNPIDIIYSTNPAVAPNITQSLTSLTTNLNNLVNYFIVKYYTDNTKTTSYEYRVYPKYQLTLPVSTSYNARDVTLMNGIVFQSGTGESLFKVSLPNTNPFP